MALANEGRTVITVRSRRRAPTRGARVSLEPHTLAGAQVRRRLRAPSADRHASVAWFFVILVLSIAVWAAVGVVIWTVVSAIG
jgi:hypothetical protein